MTSKKVLPRIFSSDSNRSPFKMSFKFGNRKNFGKERYGPEWWSYIRPRKMTRRPRGEKIYSYTLSLTSALDGVGGQRTGTNCVGGWVGPRAGLDRCEKSRLIGIRSPDRPALSEYLLIYLSTDGSHVKSWNLENCEELYLDDGRRKQVVCICDCNLYG